MPMRLFQGLLADGEELVNWSEPVRRSSLRTYFEPIDSPIWLQRPGSCLVRTRRDDACNV